MTATVYPALGSTITMALISSTSLNGNLSTSIPLPSGYSEFKFFQYSSATSGATNFTYTFNGNTGSIYPNPNSAMRPSMQPMGYVFPGSHSPLDTTFGVLLPDANIAHMVKFDWITLGTSSDKLSMITGMTAVTPITSVQVIADTVNHTGTFYVYGIK